MQLVPEAREIGSVVALQGSSSQELVIDTDEARGIQSSCLCVEAPRAASTSNSTVEKKQSSTAEKVSRVGKESSTQDISLCSTLAPAQGSCIFWPEYFTII
jgi:hypothetical protein